MKCRSSMILLLSLVTVSFVRAGAVVPDSLMVTDDKKVDFSGLEQPSVKRLEVVDRVNMATSSNLGVIPSDFRSLVKIPAGLSFSYRPGVLTSWKGGFMRVSSGSEVMPGMMGVEHGSLGIGHNLGRFTFSGHARVMRYGFYHGVMNQYGVGGAVTYHASDRVNISLFGDYYSRVNNSWMTPGMAGFTPFSSFGGMVDVRVGGGFGLMAGISTGYVPYNNRWEMRPILTPYFSVGKSKFGIDVGSWIGDILGNTIGSCIDRYNSSRKSGGGSLRPGDRGYIPPHRR